MPGADWFPGARLNYAQHVLRRERPGEDGPVLPVGDHAARGAGLAGPRERRPGAGHPAARHGGPPRRPGGLLHAEHPADSDRHAGHHQHRRRLDQLLPRLRLARGQRQVRAAGAEGPVLRGQLPLRRPGLRPQRRDGADHRAAARPGAGNPRAGTRRAGDRGELRAQAWDEVMDHPPVPAAEFEFEQVPFGHPLWILFSSGTTGLPKAITHSHGGILIEQLKLQTFHMDLRPGDRLFFHTTTGWMMWNFLVSSLLLGVRPLLYDGNPAYPGPGVLWEMAQNAKVTLFGASPAYVDMLSKAGLVPAPEVRPVRAGGRHAGRLAGVGGVRRLVLPQRQAGPVAARGSGGTDICSGFIGGHAHAARLRRRAPGPQPGRVRVRVQRAGRARHRRGRRDGDHPADAVDAGLPVERRRRRALPADVLRRLPRRVAAGRLLQGQRARRLLRARPQRRDPEPVSASASAPRRSTPRSSPSRRSRTR